MVKKLPILAILLIGSLISFGQTTTQKIEEAKTNPATPANAAKADARVPGIDPGRGPTNPVGRPSSQRVDPANAECSRRRG